MRTVAKVAGVLLVLGLLAAAAAPFVLKALLPPERVRSLVVAQAQKQLGREVKLAAVSYSLIKGLSLEDLSVSEKPDFAAGTFLAVRKFHVRAALLPLLKRTLVIDSVGADGLRLNVVKRADGTFNFSDLARVSTAPAAAASSPAPSSAPQFSLGVRAAAVSDGRVDYRDEGTGDSVSVTGLELGASGLKLSGPFKASLAARAQGKYGGKPLDAAAKVSGRFDLGGQDPRKFLADAEKLSLDYMGFTVKGYARAEGLVEPDIKADVTVSREGKELLELQWEGKARAAPGAAFGAEAEGALKAKTGGFKASELAAFGAPKSGQVPPLRVSGRVSIKGDEASAKSLEIDTPFGKVELDGGARGLGTANVVPDVSAKFDLDVPEVEASQVPGGLLPKGSRVPAVALRGRARVKGDDAVLENVRAELKQGTIEVTGSVAGLRSGKPRADVQVAAKLDVPSFTRAELPLASLPKGFVSPAFAIEGKVRVKGDDAQLEGLRLRGSAGTVDLSGSVRGLASGAPEPALDVVAKLSLPALKAADWPFLPLPAGFSLPASRWDADLFASRDEARIKALHAVVGSNDVEIAAGKVGGLRSGKPVADLTIKCRQFVLDELAHLTPALEEMAVSGSGFFALSVAGPLDKPVLGGKLQFRTLAARVSGLKLSGFTGTVSFDERRIDVPNLRGKVENGDLSLDLTVKNYAAKPAVDLEASLTEFDLGKLLAAKTNLDASRDASAQAKGKPKPSEKPATAMDLKGKFTVGKLSHPNFEARQVRSSWDLTEYTPDYKRLGGWAKFDVAEGGHIKDLASASTGKLVRVLLMPIVLVQKISKLVGRAIFPNFDDVGFNELVGDYQFSAGLMRLNESRLSSQTHGDIKTTGTIDLPSEKLDLFVAAELVRLPRADIIVTGTMSEPKYRTKVIEKALQEAGQKLIEGIFKKR